MRVWWIAFALVLPGCLAFDKSGFGTGEDPETGEVGSSDTGEVIDDDDDAFPPDDDGTTTDAEPEGEPASTGEAMPDAPPPLEPDPWNGFSAPVPVDLDDLSHDDRSPVLSSDERLIAFASNRSDGRFRPHLAWRDSISEPWGDNPHKITFMEEPAGDILPVAIEGAPSARTGNFILWYATNSGGATFDLYQVPVGSGQAAFQQKIHFCQDVRSETGFSVSADHLTTYTCVQGPSGWDIARSTRPNVLAAWTEPVPLAVANGNLDDCDPVFHNGGSLFLFTSNSHDMSTSRDIFRLSNGMEGDPIRVEELSDPSTHERDVWLNWTGDRIYFSREDAAGRFRIYTAQR